MNGICHALRRLLVLSLSLTVLLLSACAQWAGPQTLHFSPDDLTRQLERRMPLDRRLLDLLDVRISQPVVTLAPDQQRLQLSVRVQASDRLFASRLQGRLALESGVRLDTADLSVRLQNVRVLAFQLDDAGASPQWSVQRLGAAVAERMLDGASVYKLSAEQQDRMAQWGYRPEAVLVTERGLELRLIPR